MTRDHGQCRACKQIVRANWKTCAHCGVASPLPSTLGQQLSSLALVAVLVGAGWWAVAEKDSRRGLPREVRSVMRTITTVEGHGGALDPSSSGGGGGGSGGGAYARGVAGGTSGTSGGGSGGGAGLFSGSGSGPTTAADDDVRRDSDDSGSIAGGESPSRGMARRSRGAASPYEPASEPRAAGVSRDTSDCPAGSCGATRATGAAGDTLAAAMRRASDLLVGNRSGSRSGIVPLAAPPLVP